MVKFHLRNGFLVSLLVILMLSSIPGKFNLSLAPDRFLLARERVDSLAEKGETLVGKKDFALTSASNSAPTLLQYLIRLIGNDWLGADWLYLGLSAYRYPVLDDTGQQVMVTDPETGQKIPKWDSARFWVDPGPALLKTRDVVWVWGYAADAHTIYADTILVNPPSRAAPPVDVIAFGDILAISSQTINVQDSQGIKYTITMDEYTTYNFPPGTGLTRPRQGLWLHIAWLTGANGLLGRYDGFHGNYRGILRLDFSRP